MQIRVVLFPLVLIMSQLVIANPFTYTSQDNYMGLWLDEATWSHYPQYGWEPTQPGNPTNSNAGDINIYGYIRSEGSLSVSNASPVLTVYDTLYVDGDLSLGSSASMNVPSGGILVVNGDLTIEGGFNLENDGELVVVGNYNVVGGSTVTNNQDIYVFGTTEVSGGGKVNGCDAYNVEECDPKATIQNDVNLESNNSDLYAFVTSGGVLPVTLLYFTVQLECNEPVLSWGTASELSNDYFTIEKSNDGKDFFEIGVVRGAGDSNTRLDYVFTDSEAATSRAYYRLSQTDFDGTHVLLGVATVGASKQSALTLANNPVPAGDSYLEVVGATADMVWKVYDLYGRLQSNGTFIGSRSLPVGALESGVYIVRVQNEQGHVSSNRFIVR